MHLVSVNFIHRSKTRNNWVSVCTFPGVILCSWTKSAWCNFKKMITTPLWILLENMTWHNTTLLSAFNVSCRYQSECDGVHEIEWSEFRASWRNDQKYSLKKLLYMTQMLKSYCLFCCLHSGMLFSVSTRLNCQWNIWTFHRWFV